jgi:hypothetical protein
MNVLKLILVMLLVCISGCASWKSEGGVDNAWRSRGTPQWVEGTTTESEVAAVLGPPSQIISLENETVFYYLREHKQGKGLVLLLWNWSSTKAVYDRAIFFFDDKDVLTKYSYSREALPHASDD